MKTSLKSQLADGDDTPMSSDTRENACQETRKKVVKPKNAKAGGKLWFTNLN